MGIHTAIRPNRGSESPRDRPISWLFVPIGAVAGLTLGVVARVWMRWISTDPEFSWPGTIAIVGSFTVFGGAQAAAGVARIRVRRPGGIAAFRVLAIVLSVGLFGAAGAVMFPTVLFGSLAVWRSGQRKSVRLVFCALSLPGVMFVLAEIAGDHGWGPAAIGRMLLFLCIYGVIIAATWPSTAPPPERWRPSRRLLVISVCVLTALLGMALYFGGIE